MPAQGTPLNVVYLQTTDPTSTVSTPVSPGDFWWDGTNLRFRTPIQTWKLVV